MDQPSLPLDLPPPPVREDLPPVVTEHVETKVYPPTAGRPRWFVVMTHRWPGGTLVEAKEFDAGYTPGHVGRAITELLCERFLELEPF